ncbi:hypothetical protein [Thermoleptolyngbya sp. M55_K2018_002]|uniref:hypothetical protein n=1 Tax=Thermoleptolyngbya sp. M55_K2018_002 TaxID=2747808 RepID=UPI0025D5EF8A|nr:hypothetical protein [Thermoleptolyngbya sp. M55_K2018_002]
MSYFLDFGRFFAGCTREKSSDCGVSIRFSAFGKLAHEQTGTGDEDGKLDSRLQLISPLSISAKAFHLYEDFKKFAWSEQIYGLVRSNQILVF